LSQQINLFNPIFLKQKKIFTTATMARALGVLLLGGLLMVFYGKNSVAALEKDAARTTVQLTERQAKLALVNIEYAPRQKSIELEGQILQAQAELKALNEIAGILRRGELGNTEGYSGYFKALARQHVEGLWLTGVSIVGAGTDIGVRGRAIDAALVPGYLNRLTRETILQGKTFASLQINQPTVTRDGEQKPVAAPYVEFNLLSSPPDEVKK
jgi:hypothetical protein